MRSRPFISFFTQENFFAFTISHNYKSQFLIMKFQNSVLIFSYHESGLHFADFTKRSMTSFLLPILFRKPRIISFFFKILKIIILFFQFIFNPNDEPLLKHLTDDNQRIEPEWYMPIIPMVLVNGAEGIGTGKVVCPMLFFCKHLSHPKKSTAKNKNDLQN